MATRGQNKYRDRRLFYFELPWDLQKFMIGVEDNNGTWKRLFKRYGMLSTKEPNQTALWWI